jgi:phosphoribosylformylglycinamidine cyclo-ligase
VTEPTLAEPASIPDLYAPATYAAAGVDIDAGERAVERIRPLVATTSRPEVLGRLGDFGGLFAVDTERYRQPVLVACTDGVGTKALIVQATGRYETIGVDLVAMCVDDLVCQGAEPLFVLDYISTGSIDPAQITELVVGVAEGCRQVGATLLGGEMAEHARVMRPGEFELVGFAVGVVERDEILGSARVRPGDILIGLPSPGFRSNGYTLARHVLFERAGLTLDSPAWEGATTTLADELLRPSVIYTPAVRSAITAADVHSVAHITGGGLVGNLPRALPEKLRAVVERGTWEVPRMFGEVRRLGNVHDDEMLRVFNLGIGMVLIVSSDSAGAAIDVLQAGEHHPVVIGRVEPGVRGVELIGPGLWGASANGRAKKE